MIHAKVKSGVGWRVYSGTGRCWIAPRKSGQKTLLLGARDIAASANVPKRSDDMKGFIVLSRRWARLLQTGEDFSEQVTAKT